MFILQVTIELIKLIKNSALNDYRNCFLNLALPVFVFSQPAEAEKTVIRQVLHFSNLNDIEILITTIFNLSFKQTVHLKKKNY